MISALIPLVALGLTARPPIIDAHTHLTPGTEDRIDRIMVENGLAVMVNLSGGHPGLGEPPGARLAAAMPGRIVNAFTPDWYGIDEPWWGVAQALGLRDATQRVGFRALKISKALGVYVRDRAGVLVDVDDPRLDPLWDEAAALGVPVFVHTADPKAFWEPPTADNERHAELSFHPDWSFYGTDAPPRMALLDALERVIEGHPATTFILVHFGNNAEDLDYVGRLLGTYPNAYVDLAARVPEIGRHPSDRVRALFMRFQDRILFGSDIGIGRRSLTLGSSGGESPTEADAKVFFASHFRFLETRDTKFPHPTPIQGDWTIDGIGLPEAVLEKIYYGNAASLLGLPPLATR